MAAPTMADAGRDDVMHDLVLPTLLFAALGAMTWAVRGTAGASAMNAHIAPGLTWGAAWWFLARDPGGRQSRRYASGWVVLALTVGFALAGNRGWVQWPHFFEGHLSTNYAKGESVPLSRSFGFLWLFIAGAAWAGLPACLVAWCGYGRPTRAWEWTLRIACGLGAAYLASRLFARFPEVFLPLYRVLEDKYQDFQANPSLARLYRDNGAAVRHVGYCLGFLFFEVARRDWKNVTLIFTVGVLNGLGWALLQNWKWAAHVWPNANFNFWRCWECSAGVSIGVAFGIAYYLVNRKETDAGRALRESRSAAPYPYREWLLAAGLLLLVGWTAFWPPATDLRQGPSRVAPSADHVWGWICLGTGTAYAIGALAHSLLVGKKPDEDRTRQRSLPSLEYWAGMGLVLILGWFIRGQVTEGFGDGVHDASRAGLLGPGSIYYGVAVALVIVSCLNRAFSRQKSAAAAHGEFSAESEDTLNLDWLATYLGLSVILISAIGVNMATWWHAPTWFGILGAAYGVGYYLLSSRWKLGGYASAVGGQLARVPGAHPKPGDFAGERDEHKAVWPEGGEMEDPNLERWGVFVALLYGLGLSLRKTLKGGANVYLGDENYWDRVCWNWVAVLMLACLLAGMLWLLYTRLPRNFHKSALTHASGIIWLVLIAENIVAQVVTGPVFGPGSSWNDFMFNILYLILFVITAIIVYHFQSIKRDCVRVSG